MSSLSYDVIECWHYDVIIYCASPPKIKIPKNAIIMKTFLIFKEISSSAVVKQKRKQTADFQLISADYCDINFESFFASPWNESVYIFTQWSLTKKLTKKVSIKKSSLFFLCIFSFL